MELIDKSAVVAEIENLRKHYIEREDFDIGWNMALDKILSFLDTLEVKEVNLDAECRKYLTEHFNVYEDGILQSKRSGMPLDTFDVIQVARHFFELGLKAKGE